MITLEPTELLLIAARATRGASEIPANTNLGPFVQRCHAVGGGKPGDPWCADWIAMLGKECFGARWPLPATGSCQALHDFAVKHNVLFEAPATGDIFLVWHQELGRFAHAGLVNVAATRDTISGNTSGAGSREGWMVGQRVWTFQPADRFVRWAQLLGGTP